MRAGCGRRGTIPTYREYLAADGTGFPWLAVANKAMRCNARVTLFLGSRKSCVPLQRSPSRYASALQLLITLTVVTAALLYPFESAVTVRPLLALYWSRQVCIRCLPADSLEYFADIAVGNTASRVVAGGFAAVRAAGADAGAGAVVAGAAAGVADAPVPHSALR